MFNSLSVKAAEVNRHALRSPEEELEDLTKSLISTPDEHKRVMFCSSKPDFVTRVGGELSDYWS